MKSVLEIGKNGLFLDGKPFDLASGAAHYFRIHPSAWEHRLSLMRDFGLTAVETYCPWNLHEPERGQFDFDGLLNLDAFLSKAARAGLKVLLRPSPYINSECDLGGLPWWLLAEPGFAPRCMDKGFTEAVAAYYARLTGVFVPHLSTNGGPIIAVAIENEYGGYGNDRQYLEFLKDTLARSGVDVPFFTTDGNVDHYLKYGTLPGVWEGINYRIESKEAVAMLKAHQPNRAPLVGEYWSGRAGYWRAAFHDRDPEPITRAYRDALDAGASVNFYMFCGGTNFGFFSGSNLVAPFDAPAGTPEKFHAITTSYDVNALVGEDGVPRAKYFSCRKVLAEHRGLPLPAMQTSPPPRQAIGAVRLTERAPLFENLAALSRPVRMQKPVPMERLGQGAGYILYTTHLAGPRLPRPLPLFIDEVRDRAVIFIGGKPAGVYLRGEENAPVYVDVPDEGVELSILVENMGHLSATFRLETDRKGITQGVRLADAQVYGWTAYPLPMKTLSGLAFAEAGAEPVETPAFYRGRFRAECGKDAFLRLDGFRKGNVFLNGFHLGRYWNAGPQRTLYVPGGLFSDSGNEIVVFENHRAPAEPTVVFVDTPDLDGALCLKDNP